MLNSSGFRTEGRSVILSLVKMAQPTRGGGEILWIDSLSKASMSWPETVRPIL